jgi:hypothetical protein
MCDWKEEEGEHDVQGEEEGEKVTVDEDDEARKEKDGEDAGVVGEEDDDR